MSGIAAIFDRSGAAAESQTLGSIMNRMTHRGPDGSAMRTGRNVALGHLHFWTTPEELGEEQPIRLSAFPFTIAFDGRIDNRADLLAQLALPESISDAALILHAYDQWGDRCVDRFIGEFALVIHDERNDQLVLARDAMGERTLFYRLDNNRLLVASEPAAIAKQNGTRPDLDEIGVAHFFAFQPAELGRTLFRDVLELQPAEVVVFGLSSERRRRYWSPDVTRRIRRQSDGEYAEEFRALLVESVRCRMRATREVGVQMSGGLDSASVASIAASLIAPKTLTTVSYVFDDLTDCDERKYIASMQERWGIRSLQVTGDEAWPLRNPEWWCRNANRPDQNPFRLVKERAFTVAREAGLRVLMTGCYSDELHCRPDDWLADLIADGRIGEAAREFTATLRRNGFAATLRSGSVRRVGRRWLGSAIDPLLRSRSRVKQSHEWLTPSAKNTIADPIGRDANANINTMLTRMRSEPSTGKLTNLELRHPFRDRRVAEFLIALPGHQSYHRGRYKHVLRTAMTDILPEEIRTRPGPTSLAPLYFRGIEREKATLESLLQKPDASWRAYVREDWMESRWDPTANRSETGAPALIPWMCASFELWNSSLDRFAETHGA